MSLSKFGFRPSLWAYLPPPGRSLVAKSACWADFVPCSLKTPSLSLSILVFSLSILRHLSPPGRSKERGGEGKGREGKGRGGKEEGRRRGRGGEEQAKNEGGKFGRVELDLAERIQGVTF